MSEARQRRTEHMTSHIFTPEVKTIQRSTYAYAKYHSSLDILNTSQSRCFTPDPSTFSDNWSLSPNKPPPKQSQVVKVDENMTPITQAPRQDQKIMTRQIRSSTPELKLRDDVYQITNEKSNAVNETADEIKARYRTRNYSNLFGREFTRANNGFGKDRLNKLTTNWLDAAEHGKTAQQKRLETYDARRMKEENQSSTFDSYARPKFETPVKLQKHKNSNGAVYLAPKENPKTESFVLTGLHPHDDISSIRDILRGVQVVKVIP